MKKNSEKNYCDLYCPIRNVTARFSNKWSFLILLILREEGTVRFNQMSRSIPDISSKVLSTTLRTLEADGLISRKVYPEVPPRVEYKLTERGISLMPIIVQLQDWALKNMESILKERSAFRPSGAYGHSEL